MSSRRLGGIVTTALAIVLWVGCGQVYRPVVIPVSTAPPNPASFHAVFGISTNVAANPGTAMQIDVAGDTNIGEANMGLNPTHMAILPNDSRVFVASAAANLCPAIGNGSTLNTTFFDAVSSFTPAADSNIPTGLGTPVIFDYPNAGPTQSANISAISAAAGLVTVTMSAALTAPVPVPGQFVVISNVPVSGYNGCFPIVSVSGTTLTYADSAATLTPSNGGTVNFATFCPYLPDYVATTQNTTVFVANYGSEISSSPNCNLPSTDSVASLNATLNSITNIVYLPGGSHPVAMAETADGQNLYVLNQGTNNVVDLSPTDLSTLTTISGIGTNPEWAVARIDSRRVYVLAQGSGQLVPIDTTSNSVLGSTTNLSVGVGANFVLYDSNLNRLYVTNPATGTLYIFSATGGIDPVTLLANDTPTLLKTISFAAGSSVCPNGCSPVSVAAMPDGSRFYVASYQLATNCPDPNVGTSSSCIVPRLTVFNAASMAVKPVSSSYSLLSPSLSLLGQPQFASTQYAIPQNPSCAAAATFTPSSTRFRMFTTAAADSSHVYVGICDAGIVADVSAITSSVATASSNTPDTLAADILAPFGACAGATCSSVANITAFSISSNVVTFQGANNFIPGEQIAISGFSTGTYLNGVTLTVLATGLSGTQFECDFANANVGHTSDLGTAVPLPPLQSPVFLLTGQ